MGDMQNAFAAPDQQTRQIEPVLQLTLAAGRSTSGGALLTGGEHAQERRNEDVAARPRERLRRIPAGARSIARSTANASARALRPVHLA